MHTKFTGEASWKTKQMRA